MVNFVSGDYSIPLGWGGVPFLKILLVRNAIPSGLHAHNCSWHRCHSGWPYAHDPRVDVSRETSSLRLNPLVEKASPLKTLVANNDPCTLDDLSLRSEAGVGMSYSPIRATFAAGSDLAERDLAPILQELGDAVEIVGPAEFHNNLSALFTHLH